MRRGCVSALTTWLFLFHFLVGCCCHIESEPQAVVNAKSSCTGSGTTQGTHAPCGHSHRASNSNCHCSPVIYVRNKNQCNSEESRQQVILPKAARPELASEYSNLRHSTHSARPFAQSVHRHVLFQLYLI